MKMILLGAPGAGKGTQAKLISKNFNIPHISTGDILRSNVSQETELGLKAKGYMEAGALVPDELVLSLVKDRLLQEDCEKGFILDGFPRNLQQAKALNQMLQEIKMNMDRVFLLNVDKDEVVVRISGRRFCENCGSSYHISLNPSKLGTSCEVCGEALIQRTDDKKEVVLDRIKVYEKATKPLVDYYRAQGILEEISGSKDIQEVYDTICRDLQAV
ncbi:adenylate kinase [Alloiococcus sp. CFN-8]|uniref:adenylate kinase n=1 Tax=Alloiococcus sp. CFN-8 TaxID=3416081 RepID=UPI003CFB899C